MIQTSKTLTKTFIFTVVAAIVLASFSFLGASPTNATTEEELRSNIAEIESRVEANQSTLETLEAKANNLQSRLDQIQVEINQVNNQIELNELKIEELKLELEKTRNELERQKGLLADSLTEIYKRGRITTLEMLASSDNFSDYLSQQEYLENLKKGIQDSVDEVERLELKLEKEKKKQQDLLAQRKANRVALQDRESEQNEILEKTQGQQAKYSAILSNLSSQRQQAEKELDAYLAAQIASQNFVSLGRVAAGDLIGRVGSSGFSTGPHLHFETRSGSERVDPGGGGGALNYGLSWMLPNSGAGNITQWFGCVAPYDWYYQKCGSNNSFHGGIDISGWYGDPIVAPAGGDIIFRGWFGGYGNMVLIQHDNGIITAYGHLLE